MQFTTFAAALALAGLAAASPAPQQVTVTASRTTVVTITTCGAAVVNCPIRTETQVATTTYVYPAGQYATGVNPNGAYQTGGSGVVCNAAGVCVPSGGNNNGVVCNAAGVCVPCPGGSACQFGTGALTYNVPQPTGTGYKGPSFTGGAGQMKAGAALAGVGAVAALLL